jgi:3-hydroxyisobutyrate dehydrogenase-like beta-hydroxyacid dehydrogenase
MRDADDNAMTIALIGVGEMGAAVGRRLRECGARVVTSVTGRGASSAARVRDAQLEVAADDDALVRDASVVLSIVPPGVAIEVAERLRAPLRRARSQPVFVECNAIAPVTTRRIATILEAVGFVDGGIIGGPPRAGTQDPAQGPRFYVSGPQANRVTRLADFGLDIAVLDGPVGAASGLKLAYAGLTKGFTALAAAMANAAARDGLADALRVELARTQPEMLARLDRFVPQMFPKAYRWVAEMEEIGHFLQDGTPSGDIYQAIARLYAEIAAAAREPAPDDAVAQLSAFFSKRDETPERKRA